MSTNYYAYKDTCSHCGRSDEPKHIGKSSAGWCFSLRIYTDDGINDLYDWMSLLHSKDYIIKDEYNRVITFDELMMIISKRSGNADNNNMHLDYLNRNQAIIGPNGLLRSKIGEFCKGHGDGTWDLFDRTFS